MMDAEQIKSEFAKVRSFADLLSAIGNVISMANPGDSVPLEVKEAGAYGDTVRGVKAREAANAKAAEIAARCNSAADLTEEDRKALSLYTGKGGLNEGSQWEYYTPSEIASGVWDLASAMGFNGGSVLDPCCGAGVFEGTAPATAKVEASDIDPVSSKIASLLNPGANVSVGRPFEDMAKDASTDNSYDAVITNVPFGGARGVSQAKDPAYSKENQVELYFLQRLVDKLRPGGLLCCVVPTGVCSNTTGKFKKFRDSISRKAEFLGAHRLPAGTFGGAGGNGTDVVTDVIVLRKHPKELADKIANGLGDDVLKETNVLWKTFISGKWFEKDGRRFVHGEVVRGGGNWGSDSVKANGRIDRADLRRKLAQKFESRIDWAALETEEPIVSAPKEGDYRTVGGEMYKWTDGEWVKLEASNGEAEDSPLDPALYGCSSMAEARSLLGSPRGVLTLTYDQVEACVKAGVKPSPDIENSLAYAEAQDVSMRDCVMHGCMVGAMIRDLPLNPNGTESETTRTFLKEEVSRLKEKYGDPNAIMAKLKGIDAGQLFGRFASAIDSQGNFSDLLEGREDKGGLDTTDPFAIVRSSVDEDGMTFEEFKKLYTGTEKIDSVGDLADNPNIAIVPPENKLMPMNGFCWGDVRVKVALLKSAKDVEPDLRVQQKYDAMIAAFDARRKETAAKDIQFSLRDSFISKDLVLDFLGDVGEIYGLSHVGLSTDENGNEIFASRYRTNGVQRSILGWLNGEAVRNDKYADEAEQIISELEAAFNQWIRQLPDFDKIVKKYNDMQNLYIPPEPDERPLGIDKILSGRIVPHGYQNAEVRRLAVNGGGICGFGTGLGKTFTSMALIGYNYLKGRSNTTCIVVPNSVLGNWYNEAKTFYSEDFFRNKVKFVGLTIERDKDGNIKQSPELDKSGNPVINKETGKPYMRDMFKVKPDRARNQKDLLWVTENHPAIVVMTKETFREIPVKQETRDAYVTSSVARMFSQTKLKGHALATAENSMAGELAVAGGTREGRFPFLEELGFDSIIVDEAHNYKNSVKSGKLLNRVKYGPGVSTPSDTGTDFMLKSFYVRQSRMNSNKLGGGLYGLTATPITNSPAEIYNMLAMFGDPDEFSSYGFASPDDFIRQFADIKITDCLKAAGDIDKTQALMGFRNMNILSSLWKKWVNIKSIKDVSTEVHVPDGVDENSEVEMDDSQKYAYEQLRYDAMSLVGGKEVTDEFGAPMNILQVVRKMDRASTDIDLANKSCTYVFRESEREWVTALADKLRPTCVETKKWEDKDGNEFSGTVKRPCNVSPTEADGTFTFEIWEDPDKIKAVETEIRKRKLVPPVVSHLIAPKYAKLIENVKYHLANPVDGYSKQLIFTEEKSQHMKIKRILMGALGLDENRIAIINADDAKGDKLDKISAAFNSGKVDIVIANKRAEVGVNLQKGCVAIHHLTFPWTPASIAQRNGRGVRQGNPIGQVKIYFYCSKGSFDENRVDILQHKEHWIEEAMNSGSNYVSNGDALSDSEISGLIAAGDAELEAKNRAEAEAVKKNGTIQKAKKSLTSFSKQIGLLAVWLGKNPVNVKTNRLATLRSSLDAKRDVLNKIERSIENASSEKNPDRVERLKIRRDQIKQEIAEINEANTVPACDQWYEKTKESKNRQFNALLASIKELISQPKFPFDVSAEELPTCVFVGDALYKNGEIVKVSTTGGQHTIGSFKVRRGLTDVAQSWCVHTPDGVNLYPNTISEILGKYAPGTAEYDSFKICQSDNYYEFIQASVPQASFDKFIAKAKEDSGAADAENSDILISRYIKGKVSWLYNMGYSSTPYLYIIKSGGKLEARYDNNLINWILDGNFVVLNPKSKEHRDICVDYYVKNYKDDYFEYEWYKNDMEKIFGINGNELDALASKALPAFTKEKAKDLAHEYVMKKIENYLEQSVNAVEELDFPVAEWKMKNLIEVISSNDNDTKIEDNFSLKRNYSNADSAMEMLRDCLHNYITQLESWYDENEAEQIARKEEEKRKDPRFRELPKDIVDKFASINIEVDYLEERASNSFRTFEPYSVVRMYDRGGFTGALHDIKEWMKNGSGLSITGLKTDDRKFFWVIPVGNDVADDVSHLEKVYEYIKERS